MHTIRKILIEIEKRKDIADLLKYSYGNIRTSNSYGTQLYSIRSTYEIYSPLKQHFLLKKLSYEDQEIILNAIREAIPPKPEDIDIMDIEFFLDESIIIEENQQQNSNYESDEISEITKREVFDTLKLHEISLYGNLPEIEFLERLYNLSELPSKDCRFKNARGDIIQHTVNNDDWAEDWALYDDRLNIINGLDQTFMRFICEMIHPIVRPDINEAKQIAQLLNSILKNDGWELYIIKEVSKKPIYSARRAGLEISHLTPLITEKFDSEYIKKQIKRMNDSVEEDPTLAIGTAKELVETSLKSILTELKEDFDSKANIPTLTKIVFKKLKLAPEDISDNAKGADQIKMLLSNLATICKVLGELRNAYGTGHGKKVNFKGLGPRHARLIVGAAATLVTFVFETYQDREKVSVKNSTGTY